MTAKTTYKTNVLMKDGNRKWGVFQTHEAMIDALENKIDQAEMVEIRAAKLIDDVYQWIYRFKTVDEAKAHHEKLQEVK